MILTFLINSFPEQSSMYFVILIQIKAGWEIKLSLKNDAVVFKIFFSNSAVSNTNVNSIIISKKWN